MAVRKFTNRRSGTWGVYTKKRGKLLYLGAYWECKRRMKPGYYLDAPLHFKIRVVKIGRPKSPRPIFVPSSMRHAHNPHK